LVSGGIFGKLLISVEIMITTRYANTHELTTCMMPPDTLSRQSRAALQWDGMGWDGASARLIGDIAEKNQLLLF
jgi:hypothetical protein